MFFFFSPHIKTEINFWERGKKEIGRVFAYSEISNGCAVFVSINPPLAIIIIIEKKYGMKHLAIRMRAQTSTSDYTQSINPSVVPFKFSFSFDPAGGILHIY